MIRGQLSRWQVAALVVFVIVLMMSKLGTSQPNNNSGNTNTPVNLQCGTSPLMPVSSFLSNLNSTIAQLRRQLSNDGVYFARAQAVGMEDSVYGLAQCRNYLTTSECVACLDFAVSQVQTCRPLINGGKVFSNDCFLRYENIEGYYDNPIITEDPGVGSIWIGSNPSPSQPIISFNQTVEALLSDIQVATPRTPNFYVASTRQVPSSNVTVYAIGQCIQNTSQGICQNCMNAAFDTLYRCLPNSDGRIIDLRCFMRYSATPFFQINQTTNIIPFLSQGSSSKAGIAVGACGGAVVFLLILALSMWYKLRKRENADNEDPSELQGIKTYRYKDLKTATMNFSDDYRIGKGGFGEVFKAIVDNENVVAVKKLLIGHGKEKLELNSELKLMSNVRHQNLMQLLGWCSEGPELLLVLEYMPNGSLSKFLWGEKRGTLNWRQRVDIIYGIARGLAHLHDEFHIQIIHRDIKSENILLDDNFQAKVADFGLARFKPEDQSHVSTRFAGTLGYTAPEYVTRGHLSEKVDTYSFGMVTLEIISGRKCTDVSFKGLEVPHLLEHAWQLYEKEIHTDLIDEAIDSKEYEQEHVTKIIEIALICTQSSHSLRPTMSEVVLMLSSGRWSTRKKITRPTFMDPNRRILVDDKGLQKI